MAFVLIGSPQEAKQVDFEKADQRQREVSRFIFPFKNGEKLTFVGCFLQKAENDGKTADYLVYRFKNESGQEGDVTRKMLCDRGKKILDDDVTLEGILPVNSLSSEVYKACNKKGAKFVAAVVPDYYSNGTRRMSDFGVIQFAK
jgi:hypothetical protein